MTTASERAWGKLRPTGTPQPAFRPTLPDPPTTARHPDPSPHTGRESAAVANAVRNLGGKGRQ